MEYKTKQDPDDCSKYQYPHILFPTPSTNKKQNEGRNNQSGNDESKMGNANPIQHNQAENQIWHAIRQYGVEVPFCFLVDNQGLFLAGQYENLEGLAYADHRTNGNDSRQKIRERPWGKDIFFRSRWYRNEFRNNDDEQTNAEQGTKQHHQ